MKIKLSKPFASNSKVDEFDTRQMKKALNRLGYYIPNEKTGITGFPDTAIFAALKKFQKDQGLPVTGAANPEDETIEALNQESKRELTGSYTWNTVGDNRVRPEHADLEGTVRDWSDSPDPAEEINCRCWAEPVKVEKKKKRKCFDAPRWQEAALMNVRAHEGTYYHPYLDTKGLITIGIGFNVDKNFMSIELYAIDDSGKHIRAATSEDKKIAYDTLKKFFEENKQEMEDPKTKKKYWGINYLASHYENMTNVRIEEATVERMAKDKIKSFSAELVDKFPEFNCFPEPARVALMDLIWHVGGDRFNDEANNWPKLFLAVRARDWASAAEQSHRTGVEESRNEDTYDQFKEAEAIENEGDKKE